MKGGKELLLIFKSSGIGEGEPHLGEILMRNFLTALLDSGGAPDRMIFMNSGVFLTTAGSSVADLLRQFEERGTELFSCATCLEYFDRKDKLIVGKASNMRETVSAMLEFKRVITM